MCRVSNVIRMEWLLPIGSHFHSLSLSLRLMQRECRGTLSLPLTDFIPIPQSLPSHLVNSCSLCLSWPPLSIGSGRLITLAFSLAPWTRVFFLTSFLLSHPRSPKDRRRATLAVNLAVSLSPSLSLSRASKRGGESGNWDDSSRSQILRRRRRRGKGIYIEGLTGEA